MAITELTLAQWATAGRVPNRVEYINDPALTDVMYSVAGSPGVLVINLAYFADLVDGKIAGAAIDADSLAAGQIAANAVGSSEILAGAVTDAKLGSKLVKEVGHMATAVLRASGVYSADEWVKIGADTFVIEAITTDSTDDTANDDWSNTTDPLEVTMTSADYPVTGQSGSNALLVNELIYIGTEYLRVTSIDGNDVTFARACCGSSAATHADGQDIEHDAVSEAATKIPVGVQADFTEATVTPILAACINEGVGTDDTGANAVEAKSVNSGAELLIIAHAVGVLALTTTKTGTNLTWDHTAMRYGAVAGVKQVFTTAVVADSEEATANCIYVPVPFDPTVVIVQCRVTADGLEGGSSTTEHWDGSAKVTPASGDMPAYIELNNGGGSNWDASDTLYVIAIE